MLGCKGLKTKKGTLSSRPPRLPKRVLGDVKLSDLSPVWKRIRTNYRHFTRRMPKLSKKKEGIYVVVSVQ